MQIDNEAFDLLMRLSRRAQIVSSGNPSSIVIREYQKAWASELVFILNKCTVLDDAGNVARRPVEE